MRVPSVGGYQMQSVGMTNAQPWPMYESYGHIQAAAQIFRQQLLNLMS
jgi:hypothetical protein